MDPIFIDCNQLSLLVNENHHNLLLICDVAKPSLCDFLIRHTVNEQQEVHLINRLAASVKAQHTTEIVIYGLSNAPRFFRSAMEKRNRIKQLGFANVYVYAGGLYLWIANWSFLSREQFPITLSSCLMADLQTHVPPRCPPKETDAHDKWDDWHRFLGLRLLQTIELHSNS